MEKNVFSLHQGMNTPKSTWLLFRNHEQIATFTSRHYALIVVGLLNSHVNNDREL